MFTGIVEELGIIESINKTSLGVYLRIKGGLVSSEAKIGDSIAINGVCLSVTDIRNKLISFDVIKETVNRTGIGELKAGSAVNLERSLRADSRIGGHFVSGHIDYKGRIIDILKGSEGTGFRISLPSEFSGAVVEKGSVAVDGVSLTAANIQKDSFVTYLIPHTLRATTFGNKRKGDSVNIETDLMGKYIAKGILRQKDLKSLLKKYEYI